MSKTCTLALVGMMKLKDEKITYLSTSKLKNETLASTTVHYADEVIDDHDQPVQYMGKQINN